MSHRFLTASDILEQMKNCVQEEPVYCTAKCPVHVDVRAMVGHIQKGDFISALRIYDSKVLFPGIISRICHEPCGQACIREHLDAPVAIRMLEKACADFGKNTKKRHTVVQKKQKVAIIGGGLVGLSCALEKVRKGYSVTIFEKESRLGGQIWNNEPAILPPEVINSELEQLDQPHISLVLGTTVTELPIQGFDAIMVATGQNGNVFGLKEAGAIQSDPISLSSNVEGIFIGGGVLGSQNNYPAIDCVAVGGRAARSIERYIKKASVTTGRENEEIQNTRLFTETRHSIKVPQVVPDGEFYSSEESIKEACRCLLCECMECVRTCEFLTYFNQQPRQYIRDITKTVSTQKGMRAKMIATRVINSCSLCGQCKEICPENLDMGEICQEARYMQVSAKTMPPAFYDFWVRDMAFSTGAEAQLYMNQPGSDQSHFVFFPGCRTGSSDPDYVKDTYSYLLSHLPQSNVGIALSCCGIPAKWSGNETLFQSHKERFLEAWRNFGKPKLILSCPTCQRTIADHFPEIPYESLWEVMEERGLPEGATCTRTENIAVYDPCASRYAPEVQDCVRRLINQMGFGYDELKFHHKYAQCCSFGGLISTINPELAQIIKDNRVSSNSLDYVTYCTNCRDEFASNGKATWNLFDLLFGNASRDRAFRIPPTISTRRKNRRRLKQTLLKTFWNQEMKIKNLPHTTIQLNMSPELETKLDHEYILVDEIKQVIYAAETSGSGLLDNAKGTFIAHLQIGIITYWAEYKQFDNGYLLFNAYCHRMRIMEGNPS